MTTPALHADETLVEVQTADGARLMLKRRAGAGAPVIMLHGIASNADHWNMPGLEGSDLAYRSLASVLRDADHDVWLVNLRGYGGPHMRSEPPPGQDDWGLDHFILYDVPAVVKHVRRTTRRRPFVVAASMGAMVLAAYVQGARLSADEAAHEECAPVPIVRIEADRDLAAQRAADLAGCVFVEFPAALRWPEPLYEARGRLSWDRLLREWYPPRPEANFGFELMARWGFMLAVVEALGEVPLGRLRPERGQQWWRKLPEPWAERIAALRQKAVQGGLDAVGRITGARNLRAEVLLAGQRYAVDDMKAGVLRQLAESVRRRAFVSEMGTPRHVYSDHYDRVTVPTLVVAGARDRIANADVTRAAFFERITSADKTWRLFEDFAHGEFEAAPLASEKVYPVIRAWIAERDSAAESP